MDQDSIMTIQQVSSDEKNFNISAVNAGKELFLIYHIPLNMVTVC